MNATDTVAKTASGAEELRTRSRGLAQRMRTVLIMADGVQTVEQVRNASAGLGLPADFLESLVADGLVEVRPRAGGRGPARPAATSRGPATRPPPITTVDIPTEPPSVSPAAPGGPSAAKAPSVGPTGTDAERFLRTRQYLNDKVVESLGLRAFFFILKLEKCSTRAELLALLPDFEKAITKASGAEVADVLVARARELLR